jgi:hypothetical protein
MNGTGWSNRVDRQMAILLKRVLDRGVWMHGGSKTQAGSMHMYDIIILISYIVI